MSRYSRPVATCSGGFLSAMPASCHRSLHWGVMAEAPNRAHKTRSRANPGGMDVSKILGTEVQQIRGRKPPWSKVPPPGGKRYEELNGKIKAANLNTVCQEAAWPNVGECWERGTA